MISCKTHHNQSMAFISKIAKEITLLRCNLCGQPVYMHESGRELSIDEVVEILDKKGETTNGRP